MKTFELFLIVSIVVLFVYIIVRWLYKKQALYQNANTREGMEDLPYPPETAFTDPENLPLKEYAIYASFNSAYDGEKNTLKQLGTVMYNGCRFIDLNIFFSDKDLYVGFSNDNAPTMVDTSLKLSKVIEYINQYAFSIDDEIKSEVGNAQILQIKGFSDTNIQSGQTIQKTYINYPLFINIRVYRPPESDIDIIKLVAEAVGGEHGLLNTLGSVNGETATEITRYTKLKDIGKKVVLCVDYENILQIYSPAPPYDPTTISPEILKTISRFANIQIGTNNWYAFYNYPELEKNTYSMLEITQSKLSNDINYETNTTNMKLVYPYYSDMSNPNTLNYIKHYKIQTIPLRFYITDDNLTKYMELFTENKTPFLSLYHALRYIRKKYPDVIVKEADVKV
jgi:hypothetical protein